MLREPIRYRHDIGSALLHVTLAGQTRAFVGKFDGHEPVSIPSRAGLVSFTPPNWSRCGTLDDGDVVAAEVEIGADRIAEVCEVNPAALRWRGFFNENDEKCHALVAALADLARNRPADRLVRDMVQLALARHLGRAMGAVEQRRDDGWLHPSAMRRVLELIRTDPSTPPGLDELAGVAGLGASAFIRAFRGSTGRTPAAFNQRWRLDRARDALRASHDSLDVIAEQHGFASKSHLIAACRRRYGQTPGELRRIGR